MPAKDAEIRPKDGRFYCNDHFSVASIGYNSDREIISLAIVNDSKKGNLVYQFHSAADPHKFPDGNRTQAQPPEDRPKNGITDRQMHSLQSELRRTGVGIDTVKNRYGFDEPQNMSKELYEKVMKALAKTKSAGSAA